MYPSVAHDTLSPCVAGVYPRKVEVFRLLRPTLALLDGVDAFFTAASYVASASGSSTPRRCASANDTSELVPVMMFAYPGEDHRAIQPPSRYCSVNPSTSSAATSG